MPELALFKAAQRGSLEMMRNLLNDGADISA